MARTRIQFLVRWNYYRWTLSESCNCFFLSKLPLGDKQHDFQQHRVKKKRVKLAFIIFGITQDDFLQIIYHSTFVLGTLLASSLAGQRASNLPGRQTDSWFDWVHLDRAPCILSLHLHACSSLSEKSCFCFVHAPSTDTSQWQTQPKYWVGA